MDVQGLLNWKGNKVLTTHLREPIKMIAYRLAENKIGALPVLDANEKLVGVISERDIIRGLAEHGGNLRSLVAEDLMTKRVVTCRLTDTVKDIMQVMSHRRIRHLPVVDGGVLHGIISLRDVVGSQLKDAQLEVNVLRDVARTKR